MERSRPRIGRPDTWEALVFRRERARSGAGGTTILDGPIGVGKSTFLAQLLEDSRSAGFRVFRARAAEENPPPFSLIRDAVSADVERELAPPMHDPSAGTPLGLLPGLVRSNDSTLSGQAIRTAADGTRAELESDRQRLGAELAEPLFAAARKGPVLLALDDLHRADDASVGLLQDLVPRIAGQPIWILGTLDSAEPRPATGPLDALLRLAAVERLRLRALSEEEMGEFLRWLEPQRRFREADVRRLYSETGGLPMFVERLVHPPPVADGAPEAAEASGAEGAGALEHLDAADRRLLNLAVVAGNEFSFDVLAAAVGGEEEKVVEGLERLVRLGILRELEWDRFAFNQEALRQRLFTELSAPTVRNLHRRVAAALEQSTPREMETVYALARHTYLGGLDSAVQYNRQAAEYAAGSFQPTVAISYLEHAQEALQRSDPDDVAAEIGIRLELAVQRTRAGELEAAGALLKEFRADRRLWTAARATDRSLYSLLRARLFAEEGHWEEAEQVFRELPAKGPSGASVALRIATLRLRGEILYYRGNYTEALRAHDEALHLALDAGDTREAAAESIRRSTALSMLPGREEDAVAGFRSAIDQLVDVGDRAEAAFGLICLGAMLNQQGQVEEARAALQRAFEFSETAHDLRRMAWACLNLADLELEHGRGEEAEARNRVAMAQFGQLGDSLGQARSYLTEGRLALARGDDGGALKAFALARRIFAQQRLGADELEVDLREAEVQFARGRREEAVRALEGMREREFERLRPDLVPDWRRLRDRLAGR